EPRRRPAGQRGDGRRRGRPGKSIITPPGGGSIDTRATLSTSAHTTSVWESSARSPTRLILVRHGQTDRTVQGRYSGRVDVPLTGQGQAQAQAIGRRIATMVLPAPVAAVVTSPLARCAD